MQGIRRSRLRAWVIAVAAVAVIASAVAGVWWTRFATYHFATVRKGVLYRDGNRSMREFAHACQRARIRTVVMLNDEQEARRKPFSEEADFCRAGRIRLERIPISPGERPSSADVRLFLDIVADPDNQPVLVHCAQGLRRTGMMVAAYQLSVLNYTPEQAKAGILLWGRKPERLDDVRGFIDDYDPQRRSVGLSHVVRRDEDKD